MQEVQQAKHTPGPWYLFKNRHNTGGGLYGEEQGSVAWKAHPAMGAPTPLPGVSVSWKGEQGKATARLIAAAPELLEALLGLATSREHGEPGDICFCQVQDVYGHSLECDSAMSAIAKARGQA